MAAKTGIGDVMLTIEQYSNCMVAHHGIQIIETTNDSGLLTLIERTYPKLAGFQHEAIRDRVRLMIPLKQGKQSLLDLWNVPFRMNRKEIGTSEIEIPEKDFDLLEEEEDVETIDEDKESVQLALDI